MEPRLLESLGLCSSAIDEFMSTMDAVDLFLAKFQTRGQGELNAKITLNSFTLDIAPFPVDERVKGEIQDFNRYAEANWTCGRK
ncbi:hypothetical protein BGZ92_011271 [Podila epicladia]|nr:hypothetical protein BGZ92_011271 [Podila epicladia]